MSQRPAKNQPANPSVQVQAATRSELWQGPLPPPQTLEQYEKFLPGAAERIMIMAENEAKFRHTQTEQLNNAMVADTLAYRREVLRGQICGLSVALGGSIASVVAAYLGATAIGVTVGGTCLVGLVTAFLGARRSSETPHKD